MMDRIGKRCIRRDNEFHVCNCDCVGYDDRIADLERQLAEAKQHSVAYLKRVVMDARRAALEEAAQICDSDMRDYEGECGRMMAAAIRALAEKEPE